MDTDTVLLTKLNPRNNKNQDKETKAKIIITEIKFPTKTGNFLL